MLEQRLSDPSVRFTRACCYCHAILEQGDPGAPTSHGIGPCCWAEARSAAGLAPAPYPSRRDS